MTAAPPPNRRFLLRERPSGDFDPKIMERVVEPAPTPGPGQALVQLFSGGNTSKLIVEIDDNAAPIGG